MGVLEGPEDADHNDLLLASSAFLDALPDPRTDDQELARRMAYAACDLAVFYDAEHYAKLRTLALAFKNRVTT